MSEENATLQLIEQYLSGALSPEQEQDIHLRIDEDEHFAQLVKERAAGRYLARSTAKDELTTSLKAHYWQQKETSIPSKRLIIKPWYYLSAAVILILLVFGLRSWLFTPSIDTNEIFAQYYEQASIPEIRGVDTAPLWETAKNYYQGQAFDQASLVFQEIIEDSTMRYKDRARFFLGLCYLEMNQADLAAHQFEQLSQSMFRDQSMWFTALAWLKIGNLDKTKASLQTILQRSRHYKMKEAETLQKQLSQ
ncbi:MAG: tetratricopeptide repeat protein [Bacteroidota bacterium]